MSGRIRFLASVAIQCRRCHVTNIHHQQASRVVSVASIHGAVRCDLTENNRPHIPLSSHFTQIRHKFDKRKNKRAADDDDDNDGVDLADFVDDLHGGKDHKVTKVKVTSLRTDLLIKSGLGMARNKVEAAFYDSKIRINGKKVPKKSAPIRIGDEIDVIKEFSPLNPDNLVVARIEVLSVSPNTEDITVVMRRYKSLTIENYEAENVWRQSNVE